MDADQNMPGVRLKIDAKGGRAARGNDGMSVTAARPCRQSPRSRREP